MKKIKIITSWDDGTPEDMELVAVLNQYDIPAIFYLTNKGGLSKEDICYIDSRYEIGGHTASHCLLTRVNPDVAEKEIIDNKKWLEEIIGHPIESFAYPRGYFSDEIRKMVKDAGYKNARSVILDGINESKDKFAQTTSAQMYPGRHEEAEKLIDELFKKGGVFHLWGHSKDLFRFQLWNRLSQILNYIESKKKEID